MIVINGFDELLKKCHELPDVGWLYVGESFDLESKKDINEGRYFIAQDEDEEMDFEENYGTFLEAPIFKAIIENKLEHHPDSDRDDFFNAVIHYLENDDFMD
ncbi:DUF7716 domain-containing protein [Pantoea allii]|uniref:DUF7716 domain-containing protein n=1 Tax=Pantoea allii TaxID=574096 RepID=UPI000BB3F627|nr:hypothetical protein [Pantoea allii]MBW1253206.1 hypothetical protein [Pantoea allii]MBW1262698.1 hypothetical protein [Pantoea allii]MBW1284536.1 hypothetical protein [Pantoea allii]PBJ99318.1 hypothetical protein CMR03_15495 [Pantoea allii]